MPKRKKHTLASLTLAALLGVSTLAEPSEWAKDAYTTAEGLGLDVHAERAEEYASRLDFCRLAYGTLGALIDLPAAVDSPFEDTDDTSVAALHRLRVVKGKEETRFCPADGITREEAAVLLMRMFDVLDIGYSAEKRDFADMDKVSDWAKEAVEHIPAFVMEGVGQNTFAPSEPYTCEQCVTTLMRMYEYAVGYARTAERPTGVLSETLYEAMPTDRNYMFSPLSVKIAFGLAAKGAEGQTKRELLDFLCVSNERALEDEARAVLADYGENNPIMSLSMANGIFLNTSRTYQRFSKTYIADTADIYKASAAEVTDENAVETVNAFAAEHTNGKITGLIDKPDFTAMLINALYFKGQWQDPFYPAATEKDVFTDRLGNKRETDFMHRIDHMAYSEEDGVRILELPYSSSDYIETDDGYERVTAPAAVSMYLLMGDTRVTDVEKRIRETKLSHVRIRLSLPKFTIGSTMRLEEMLPSLASLRAFDAFAAEFAPMVTQDTMYIDSVLHKTYIDVDENGTEAAAVTAIGMKAGAAPVMEPPLEVKFDHPFTFVIFDKTHDEVLFMGEYAFVE